MSGAQEADKHTTELKLVEEDAPIVCRWEAQATRISARCLLVDCTNIDACIRLLSSIFSHAYGWLCFENAES